MNYPNKNIHYLKLYKIIKSGKKFVSSIKIKQWFKFLLYSLKHDKSLFKLMLSIYRIDQYVWFKKILIYLVKTDLKLFKYTIKYIYKNKSKFYYSFLFKYAKKTNNTKLFIILSKHLNIEWIDIIRLY